MSTKLYVITEGDYSSPNKDLIEFLETFSLMGECQVENMFESRPLPTKDKLDKTTFRDVFRKEGKKSIISEDLQKYNPEVLLIIGSNACEYYFGHPSKKVFGNPEEITIDGKNYTAFGMGALRWLKNNRWTKNEKVIDLINKIKFQMSGVEMGQETQYSIIDNIEKFKEVLEMCKQTKTFCFDFETSGLNWHFDSEFATILSISFQHGYSYILPLWHFDSPFNEKQLEEIFKLLEVEIFNNRKVNKIAHNLKFDLHWMRRYGVEKYDGRFNDTMLMSHILDENSKNGLKDLARKYFIKFTGYEDEVGKYKWEEVPLDILSKYAALDTDLTLRLYHLFEELLIEENLDLRKIKKIKKDLAPKEGGDFKLTSYDGLTDLEYLEHLETMPYRLYLLYRNLTMPAFFALFDAEHHGARIDPNLIRKSIEEAEIILENKYQQLINLPEIKKFENHKRRQVHESKIEELEQKIEKRLEKYKPGTKLELKYREQIRDIKSGELVLYEGLNFASPTQLKEFLFTPMGLNLKGMYDARSKKYVQTTKREYLAELEADHKFVLLLLAYRSISSMVSTFYKGILEKLDKNDMIHTSFLLHGTTSGRLASRGPNLQNIPARIKFKDDDAEKVLKMVKKFFINLSEDYYMVQADYSQAELRVIANFSGDKKMIETYKNDYDIHAITASNELGLTLDQFYKLDPNEVKKHRTSAKGTNFGLVYDMSIQGYLDYARNNYGVHMEYEEAQTKYNKFFGTYSSLKAWHKTYVEFAEKYGYVRTLFGRKRRLLSIQSPEDSPAKGADIRAAINSPIQGTSGEYTIFSASILRHRLPKDCIFFNTVHDSIFFYIPKEKLDQYLEIIFDACENPPIEKYFNVWEGHVNMKMDIELTEECWGNMVEFDKFFKKSK